MRSDRTTDQGAGIAHCSVEQFPHLSSVVARPDNSTAAPLDAEANGWIVVKQWEDIGERGVYAVDRVISARTMLGALSGAFARPTRPNCRRIFGIRINGSASDIDVGGRWPEMINHGPPPRCNVESDPDTRPITTTRDIAAGEQLFFDYGVGYWTDTLMGKDYDAYPRQFRAHFDLMHSEVHNYAWFSHTFSNCKLVEAIRIAKLVLYLSQQEADRQLVKQPPSADGELEADITSYREFNAVERCLAVLLDQSMAMSPSA